MVGITGTNGKSTVTTLVGRMAERAGSKVRVGGNLGEPALDLLKRRRDDAAPTDLYVLGAVELPARDDATRCSSPRTVLNVTPDHMDRYATSPTTPPPRRASLRAAIRP